MMKRIAAFLCCVVLVSATAQGATFLAFGDSLTYGANGRSSDAYLDSFADYMNSIGQPATMINGGVGAEDTNSGAQRLASLVNQVTVDYVLILEGTNDLNAWNLEPATHNPGQTEVNYHVMIDACRSRGFIPILATIPPRVNDALDPFNTNTQRVNDIIRGVANSKGVAIAELYSNVLPLASTFTYWDSIHPLSITEPLHAEAFASAVTGTAIGLIDLTPPLPVQIEPFPLSVNNAVNTNIVVTLEDRGSAIELASMYMIVDGVTVTPTVTDIGSGRVRMVYDPPVDYRLGQTVYFRFFGTDLAVIPNSLEYQSEFTVSPGNGTSGDIDRSGRIDGRDVAILAIAFGTGPGDPRWRAEADIDASGFIDGIDLSLLTSNFGGTP